MKTPVLLLLLASACFAQTAHTITLVWTAPASGGAVATYSVQRSTASGGPYSQIVSVPSVTLTYTDTSSAGNVLVEGQKYCYVIAAVNASGTGPNSNEVCATVPLSPPGPPSLNSAVAK